MPLERSHSQALSRAGRPKTSKNPLGKVTPTSGNCVARYPSGTPGSRLSLLGDGLARITARWERLNPPPVRPIPVLIGGGGERKTLRHVARYAHIWHAFGGPDTQARKAAILAEHCAVVGRDPNEIERSTAAPRWGSPDAQALLDLGVTLFTIGVSGPDYDLSVIPEWVKWRDSRNADRGQ